MNLTDKDIAKINEIGKLLINPLEFASLDDWRAEVSQRLKEILGADKCVFQFPSLDGSLFYTKDYDINAINEFPDRVSHLDKRYDLWNKAINFGVFDRKMLFGNNLKEVIKDEYYTNYVRKIRAFDSLIMCVKLGYEVDARDGAMIMFHHDNESGPFFGVREMNLLRLLKHCFDYGVQAVYKLQPYRLNFGIIMDTLPDGVVLLDHRGKLLHFNSALKKIKESSNKIEWNLFWNNILHYGSEIVKNTNIINNKTKKIQCDISGNIYDVLFVLLNDNVVAGKRCVVILVSEKINSINLSDLQVRFKLTPKEAEVTRLLAKGLPNKEIAQQIGLSPHTIRRHTEHIFEKLGINSRAEVAIRIIKK